MSKPASTRPTIAQLWTRAQKWPMGHRIFSYLIGRQARYTGTIGARVVELDHGVAVVEMADKPAVRNHLKSVHAIALMNLGELCTGLSVMHQIDGKGRGIVKNLSMEYTKKARGTITAECRSKVPTEAGDHDFIAEGVLKDSDGDIVAKCTATWRLQVYGVEASEEAAN